MGFSVSGAAVLLFAGLLVAFGMWSTAAANSVERVTEAESARADDLREQRNTAIEITEATWSGSELSVTVENRGVTTLRESEFDVIVDGVYVEYQWESSISELIQPDQSRGLTVSRGTTPDRVKVVTLAGIAASTEVN